MKLTIDSDDFSAEAIEVTRLKLNAPGSKTIDDIKMHVGGLISVLGTIRANGPGVREAAVAITNLQTAYMWAILAATKEAK